MTDRVFLICVIISTQIFVVSAFGEDSIQITLSESVKLAYEKNPGLEAARSQYEAAEREKAIARSNFFPRLGVEQNYVNTDQQVNAFGIKLNQGLISQNDFNPDLLNDPDKITNYGTSIVLQQPIFNGGQEILGYKLADSAIKQAWSSKRIAEETVLFETVKSYLGAALAREGLVVAKDALKTAETNLRMIQHRFDEGIVIKSDVLQAKVHVAELKQRKVNAEYNLRLALAGFNTMLGNPGDRYFPSDELDGGGCPPVELDMLKQWGLADRPELQALAAQKEMAKLQVKFTQTPFLPSINAQGSYDYNGESILSDGSDSATLAVSLRFNLFNGMGDFHRVKQAKTRLIAVNKLNASKQNIISLEIEKAFLDLKSAEQRLEVTSDAVSQAEESLRILTQRYREGAAGIVDLLRTELALANARFNQLQAKHDMLLGNAALCRSVGHLYTRWLEPDKCPVPPVEILN